MIRDAAQRVVPDADRVRTRFFDESQRIRTRRARRALPSLYRSTSRPQRRSSSPVILVGMHRSGTSLTARVLEELGVDMGPDVSHTNHESHSFLMRNRLLLSATKADWDHPQPLLDALDDPDWKTALALLLEQTITSPRSWLLGLHEPPSGPGANAWGWKDPRNTLTWPLWLELYPNARFVRVQRHRADAITSLVTRSHKNLQLQADLSIRTLSEHGADSLCSDYDRALAPLAAAVDSERIFDIRYEDLVVNPIAATSKLAAWVGADQDDVAAAAALVRPALGGVSSDEPRFPTPS